MDEFTTVVEAAKRLKEDLALIEGIPVQQTQAGRQSVVAMKLAAHERFSGSILALVEENEAAEPVAPTPRPEPVPERRTDVPVEDAPGLHVEARDLDAEASDAAAFAEAVDKP